MRVRIRDRARIRVRVIGLWFRPRLGLGLRFLSPLVVHDNDRL